MNYTYQKDVRLARMWVQTAPGIATTETATTQHLWDDCGMLIGFELMYAFGLPDIMNTAEGLADGYAYFSLSGNEQSFDHIIAQLQHRIHSAFEAFGVGANLEGNKYMNIMFPEGTGIEFNKGDLIYLHAYHRDGGILAAGVMYSEANVQMYWLERK